MEDEWERELEADEDLDVLFITFQPSAISLDKLTKTIEAHGFSAEVQEDG